MPSSKYFHVCVCVCVCVYMFMYIICIYVYEYLYSCMPSSEHMLCEYMLCCACDIYL